MSRHFSHVTYQSTPGFWSASCKNRLKSAFLRVRGAVHHGTTIRQNARLFFQRTAFFFEKSPFNEKSFFIRKISRSHFFWAHKRHKNQEEPFSRKLLELGDHLWQAKMANVSELLRKFPFFHGKLLAWQSIAFGDAHDLPKIIPFSAEKLTNSIRPKIGSRYWVKGSIDCQIDRGGILIDSAVYS